MGEQKLTDTEREAADAKMVDDAFKRLLDSYLASPHRKKVDIITKAFNFARQAHKGVRRLSGEPYSRGADSVDGDGTWLNEYQCGSAP